MVSISAHNLILCLPISHPKIAAVHISSYICPDDEDDRRDLGGSRMKKGSDSFSLRPSLMSNFRPNRLAGSYPGGDRSIPHFLPNSVTH